tara:strand:+ start:77 stop:589 length:513 start_codon:yes stop_codon:yes gene_type:complete
MKTLPHLFAATSQAPLSPADKKTIAAARKELERTDSLLEEVNGLKQRYEEAGSQFALGKVDLLTAAALLSSSDARAMVISNLRPPIKQLQREIVATCKDIIVAARQHTVDELHKKCASLEATERRSSSDLGIHNDNFKTSDLLERLCAQHKLALEAVSDRVSRANLNQLP